MKVHTQVQLVFAAQFDDAIHLRQCAFLDLEHVLGIEFARLFPIGIHPQPVVHRQAHVIKSPIPHPTQISFGHHALTAFAVAEGLEEVGEVEAPPPWNGGLRRWRGRLSRGEKARAAGQRGAAGNGSFQELTT